MNSFFEVINSQTFLEVRMFISNINALSKWPQFYSTRENISTASHLNYVKTTTL